MVVKLVIQIVIVLDCTPLGAAGKGPLVEMVKDDGACACNIEIVVDFKLLKDVQDVGNDKQ